MKLTTKGRYAVMAMADLASYSNNKPVSLSEISKRQNISLAYLEQLFIHLKDYLYIKFFWLINTPAKTKNTPIDVMRLTVSPKNKYPHIIAKTGIR